MAPWLALSLHPSIRLSVDHPPSNFSCSTWIRLLSISKFLLKTILLPKFLNSNDIKLDAALNVDVDASILIRRMVGRRVCKTCGATYHVEFNPSKVEGVCDNCGSPLIQRPDDTEETAVNRLSTYDAQTAPLLDFYAKKSLLKTVNGDQPLEKVFDDIKAVLGK